MTNRRARMLLVVLTGLALSLGSLGNAQDDADSLRRLAERLVGAWGAPGDMRVTLEVGALPQDLPIALPIPEGFDVLGSLVREERGELVSAQAVLDGPERTTDAFEALRTAFEADGWVFLVDGGMSGFVPAQPNLFARACAPLGADDTPATRPMAFVYVSWVPGGRSDVRIDLSRDVWEGACTQGPEAEWGRFAPVPALAAPEGALLTSPAAMYDMHDAVAIAILRDLDDLGLIVAHYEMQLAGHGWTRVADEQGAERSGVSARSDWRRDDAQGHTWHLVFGADRAADGEAIFVRYAVTGAGARDGAR
jgi:hypothetical protein